MKKALTSLLVSLIIILTVNSQTPQSFKYQAVVRNSNNEILSNQQVSLRFSILKSSSTGTLVYSEVQSAITSPNGLISLNIGDGNSQDSISKIVWTSDKYFLKVEMDASGGTDYTLSSASEILPVPLAMYAINGVPGPKGDQGVKGDTGIQGPQGPQGLPGTTSWIDSTGKVITNKHVGINNSYPQGMLVLQDDGNTMQDTALFEVKDKNGQTIFAVYNEGVRINFLEGAKGAKGGFTVGGRNGSKGVTANYFTVTPDSTSVLSNIPAKGAKGGFTVGGRNPSKGSDQEYFNISSGSDAESVNPSQSRILWYPRKEAFLTGQVLIESPDSVGTNSFASGYESKAVGNFSQALGYRSVSRGPFSSSLGYLSKATGFSSFAMGIGCVASGQNSFAFGNGSQATGQDSYAFGVGSQAIGSWTFAFGYHNKAVWGPSYAFGDGTQSLKWGGTSFGWATIANAEHSIAMGHHTITKTAGSLVLGCYNDTTASVNAWTQTSWSNTDALLIVGNGNSSTRKNAFTVLQSGKTGINMNYPSYFLDVKGRARFMSDGSNTSGFWLTTLAGTTDKSFVGMADDTHVGFYGGLGWGLVMDVTNNKMGIGTNAPSSYLEVTVNGNDAYSGVAINSKISGGKYLTINQGTAGKINFTNPGIIDLFTIDFINNRVGVNTASPSYIFQVSGGAYCTGTTWVNTSDKHVKENFIEVDGKSILNKIEELPILMWNYKKENSNVRHIGPMAQDFYAIFELGNDTTSISTIDPAGISLAAIKELNKQNSNVKQQVNFLSAKYDELFVQINKQETISNFLLSQQSRLDEQQNKITRLEMENQDLKIQLEQLKSLKNEVLEIKKMLQIVNSK
jgi:hypothetical protein